jgi:flagellar biosynthesis protein FlhB
MSEQGDDQERTEQPTPKRLDEARKRGDIPRSRDFSAAAVLLAAGTSLYYLGGYSGGAIYNMMRTQLTISPEQAMYDGYMVTAVGNAFTQVAIGLVPIFGLVALAATLAPLTLGGWAFSTEALAPDFSRMSPVKGFARMFSMQAVLELCKSLAKFTVVGLVVLWVLKRDTAELLQLGNEPSATAIVHAFKVCGKAFIALTAGLLIIAAIDVPIQLWQYNKKLKMTRQEIRDEMKESEGSPEVKGRIRRLQQEMAQRRMMTDVPKADVVVTNPTHFAVALRYDENRMRAPIVVAKGADLIAARIREIANEHNVTIFEAPPLARALHAHVEIGSEIPQGLYAAVAQVLTYVFQLRAAKQGMTMMPTRPEIDVGDPA